VKVKDLIKYLNKLVKKNPRDKELLVAIATNGFDVPYQLSTEAFRSCAGVLVIDSNFACGEEIDAKDILTRKEELIQQGFFENTEAGLLMLMGD
jgi:hypothetical protein